MDVLDYGIGALDKELRIRKRVLSMWVVSPGGGFGLEGPDV